MPRASMKKIMFAACALGASMALSSTLVAAQNAPAESLGMVTGPSSGTYIRFGQDIAKTAKEYGVDVQVLESNGSIENIKRMSQDGAVSLGIVQSDLLGFLSRSEDEATRKMAQGFRMLYPFYPEEVHLFARRNVAKLSDLSGKRIAVGAEGSGHWVTAMNIINLAGIKPGEVLRLAPAEAAAAVLQGKADAMFFAGGKPVKLFENMRKLREKQGSAYAALLENVHFVPLNDSRLLAEYSASNIYPSEYGFEGQQVPTIAVTAVLMGYSSTPDEPAAHNAAADISPRCEAIGKLGLAIRDKFSDLQRTGHPKWKEVKLAESLSLWKQDPCVNAVQAAQITGADPFENELLKTIRSGK